MSRKAKAKIISDEIIAHIACLFDHLMEHKLMVDAHLGYSVKERQLFVLLLALESPVGAPEIKPVVKAMKGTRHYANLARLGHHQGAYHTLWPLAVRGLVARMPRGRRVLYRLTPTARDTLRQLLASLAHERDSDRRGDRAGQAAMAMLHG